MSRIGLKIERFEEESWRDCAARYGRMHGLELQVTIAFDAANDMGVSEQDAAIMACREWHVCDLWHGD